MSRWPRVFALGLSMALGACAVPPPMAGGDRPDGAPRYQVQQVDPIQRLISRYRPGAEQELVDATNQAQQRGGRAELFVAARLRTLARAQSRRMAIRGAVTFTDEDRAAMKIVISPSSLPPRDWWVFINRVGSDASTGTAQALINSGPRPFVAYNLYALKPTFNAIGAGVYRGLDGQFYGTIIVVDHEAR